MSISIASLMEAISHQAMEREFHAWKDLNQDKNGQRFHVQRGSEKIWVKFDTLQSGDIVIETCDLHECQDSVDRPDC